MIVTFKSYIQTHVKNGIFQLLSYFCQLLITYNYLFSTYQDLENVLNMQAGQKVVDKLTSKQTHRQTKHSTSAVVHRITTLDNELHGIGIP